MAVQTGLLDADTPNPQGAVVVRATQREHYFQLVEELQRVHKERIEGLIEHLDIKDQLNAQLQRELEDYVDKIAEYVERIMRLEKEGDDVF